jgi:hypothetical protein
MPDFVGKVCAPGVTYPGFASTAAAAAVGEPVAQQRPVRARRGGGSDGAVTAGSWSTPSAGKAGLGSGAGMPWFLAAPRRPHFGHWVQLATWRLTDGGAVRQGGAEASAMAGWAAGAGAAGAGRRALGGGRRRRLAASVGRRLLGAAVATGAAATRRCRALTSEVR